MANSLAQPLDNPKEGACLVVTLQENLAALQEIRNAFLEAPYTCGLQHLKTLWKILCFSISLVLMCGLLPNKKLQ